MRRARVRALDHADARPKCDAGVRVIGRAGLRGPRTLWIAEQDRDAARTRSAGDREIGEAVAVEICARDRARRRDARHGLRASEHAIVLL